VVILKLNYQMNCLFHNQEILHKCFILILGYNSTYLSHTYDIADN